jgi:hypothetical protein
MTLTLLKMAHIFDVTISRDEAIGAIRRLVVKILGKGGLVFLAICLGCVVWDFLDGVVGWITITTSLLLALCALVVFVGYFLLKRFVPKGSGIHDDYAVSYEVNSVEIAACSNLGRSVAKWGAITRLWIESELTILFTGEGGCTIIPTQQIPQGALDFLTMQVERRGVPVLNWSSGAEQHVVVDETKL